jgi:hypothetical protein
LARTALPVYARCNRAATAVCCLLRLLTVASFFSISFTKIYRIAAVVSKHDGGDAPVAGEESGDDDEEESSAAACRDQCATLSKKEEVSCCYLLMSLHA